MWLLFCAKVFHKSAHVYGEVFPAFFVEISDKPCFFFKVFKSTTIVVHNKYKE